MDIRILHESTDKRVLNKLLELHKEFDKQEKEASAGSVVDILADYPGWFDDIEKCLDYDIVLGVFDSGELAGFATGCIAEGYSRKSLNISSLYIAEEHRRKGYGKALYKRILTEAGDIKSVSLVAYTGNTGALAFYKSIGLEIYAHYLGKEV
ncbi:GNAT family N-acetyltransferase [Salmonella enterica]|nr:GNAT family N-acetyltransferase [Salmonella enterica]